MQTWCFNKSGNMILNYHKLMIEIRYQSPSRMCSNANTSMKLNNEKFATSEMQTSGIKI